MRKRNSGISLVSLIITIIVIIILAAIVIFSGMGTPEKAQLSAVINDIDNVQTAVDQAYYGLYTEKSVEGEVWTKSQIYEAVSTGETNRDKLIGKGIVEISEDGMVKMNLPKYEGRKWGVAIEDIDETTKAGSVVLIPGFESDNKIYSTLLDVQNAGRTTADELTMNAELSDNSAAKLLEVGDYINYIPDIKTYTPDASILGVSNSSLSTEDAIWRVWYVNKATGEVMISPETCVNEFKINIMLDTEKSPEVDKICNILYSNSNLNIKAYFLTINDINKAFGYDGAYTIKDRYAYFLSSDTDGSGDSVMYKGEKYNVSQVDEFIIIDTDKLFTIEGGETIINSQGKSIRKVAKGKPIYVAQIDKGYELNNYNETISSFLRKKETNVRSLDEWISENNVTTKYKHINKYYNSSLLTNTCIYFNYSEPKKLSYNQIICSAFNPSSYPNYPTQLVEVYTVRPKIVLTATNLIDTSDTTKNGETQATAWELKK